MTLNGHRKAVAEWPTRMIKERFASEGIRYELNSIEKMIRPAVKEWEERNPDNDPGFIPEIPGSTK